MRLPTDNQLEDIRLRLEKLGKSFNAIGYQGMQNAGRTGIGALVPESVDPVMYSICAQEKNLKLIKNIKTVQAKSSVYNYKVQTAVATQGIDLSGFENFMPQSDMGNYEWVAEPLKIYGIRQVLGDMVRMTGDAGGFQDGIDPEKENEKNAAMALAQQFERDGYVGGDYYMTSTGEIDTDAGLRMAPGGNRPQVRQLRGIQANIREGNKSSRGVTTDFLAYANSHSVVFDNKGARLSQDILDDISTAVSDNAGQVGEAHATATQIAEFRKTFYGIQRADISSQFAIRGPDVQGGEDASFTVTTSSGPIKFMSCLYKNAVRQKAMPQTGTNGQPPSSPTVTAIAEVAGTSELQAGDQVRFIVQATNLFGMSVGTQTAIQTVASNGAAFQLTIAAQAGVEGFMVFMTPREAAAKAGSEGFVGRISAARSGATTFTYNGAIIPGYESVLFLPTASEDRVKLAVLGNLLNKSDLGRTGLATEMLYSSYLCIVLTKPRSFSVLDNVQSRRRM